MCNWRIAENVGMNLVTQAEDHSHELSKTIYGHCLFFYQVHEQNNLLD